MQKSERIEIIQRWVEEDKSILKDEKSLRKRIVDEFGITPVTADKDISLIKEDTVKKAAFITTPKREVGETFMGIEIPTEFAEDYVYVVGEMQQLDPATGELTSSPRLFTYNTRSWNNKILTTHLALGITFYKTLHYPKKAKRVKDWYAFYDDAGHAYKKRK